jgi:hypothetical protein
VAPGHQSRRTTDLIFPSPDGSPWNLDRVNNWRSRTLAQASAAAGQSDVRPYDLRHSFISLLIAQGGNVVEVAAQAGHSPTMALSTYAHLFEEHRGGRDVSAEESIRAPRHANSVTEVSVLCPPEAGDDATPAENPRHYRMGDPGLEPGTSSLSEKRSNQLS